MVHSRFAMTPDPPDISPRASQPTAVKLRLPLSPTTRCSILVLVISVASYLPVVFNGFVDWDDKMFLTENPWFNPPMWATVRHAVGAVDFHLYIPVTATIWAGLAKIAYSPIPDVYGWHLEAWPFHLASVLIHAGTALVLFKLLRLLVLRDFAAMVGALVFSMHPIQVEPVACAAQLPNPLAGFFSLVALWQFLLYLSPLLVLRKRVGAEALCSSSAWNVTPPPQPSPGVPEEGDKSTHYILATIAFVLALGSKPSAIVLPLVAWAMACIVASDGRSRLRLLLPLLPWCAIGVACAIWTAMHQPAAAVAQVAPLWFRPFVACDTAAFYLWKVLIPVQFGVDYGRTPWFLRAHAWGYVTWLLPAGLLLAAWMGRRRRPMLLLAAATFLIALLPNSGIVSFDYQAFSTVANRYAYLAMAAVALAVADVVAMCPSRRAILALAVVVLAAFFVLTEMEIPVWRNGETVFRRAVEVNPDSWMSWDNLAVAVRRRSLDESIALCRRAVAAAPQSWDAQFNLATVLTQRSPDESIALCRWLLERQPNDAATYDVLGQALLSRGDRTAARQAFQSAHMLDPTNPQYSADSNSANTSQTTQP
jgi:protein O-mannosyl-transferase